MTLNDHLKQIQDLLAKNPEAGEMELMQTSCFDEPYRWDVSGIYIGEAYVVDPDGDNRAIFNNEDSAEERKEEYELEGAIEFKEVVVIEAY